MSLILPHFFGKPEIREKRQKNVQITVNFMTILFIPSLCESIIGSIASANKVVKYPVSSPDIYL